MAIKLVGMQQSPNATLLFHLSDELTDRIVPTGKRPKFYWFNDRYHSHIYGNSPGADYMYFFLVQPGNTAAKLFTRHGEGDFKSMWSDYARYLMAREANENNGVDEYLEPGIVLSFSELVPDLVCKFEGSFAVTAKTMDGSKKATFSLLDNGKFRRFDQIPELSYLLPGLLQAAPLTHPSDTQVSNPSNFWPADSFNQGRMWL